MLRLLTSLFSISLLSFSAWAQSRLVNSKTVHIEYRSPSWNKKATSNDVGAVLLRDSNTKKMARIEVTETENNSGFFVGDYVVSWGGQDIVPEIYIAPAEMMKSTEQMKKIEKLIQDGTLLRKPFFLRSEDRITQTLTIYDTPTQALAAFETFRKTHVAGNVNRAAFEAQAAAAKIDKEKSQSENAKKVEQDQQKMMAEEKRKQDELMKKQSEMSGDEKAKRQKEARQLSDEAMALYKKDSFPAAEEKFAKAVELDPANTSFYFQYGITLNRTDKFNKSLAVLNLARGSKDVSSAQIDFYSGLNYMKLKDDDRALKSFESSKQANDKAISPIAAFYVGVIQFQQEKYEQSKINFEFVLDNSSDPNFDKQAETYIEQIANAMAFKKEQDKKFILTLNGGLQYDSNILAVSNSTVDAGNPTELEGYRWTYGASLEYRPVYSAQNEFSVVVAGSDMYTTNNKFRAEQQFQNTDPLIFDVTLPYKYKGKALGKAYMMGLTPGYESIRMNQDGSGEREGIVISRFIKNDHTLIMNDNWFANYALEIRQDTAQTNTGGSDDQTANKLSLTTSQTFFQNQKKTEAWIADLGLSQNSAAGANAEYRRYDLAATYMMPWKWDTAMTARLSYYSADYSRSTAGRKDGSESLTLGLRKPFTESLIGSLAGVYSINSSNVEANTYKKTMILANFTWTTSL